MNPRSWAPELSPSLSLFHDPDCRTVTGQRPPHYPKDAVVERWQRLMKQRKEITPRGFPASVGPNVFWHLYQLSGALAPRPLVTLFPRTFPPPCGQPQHTGKHRGLLREGLSSGDHSLLPLHPVSRVWVWTGWASWLPRGEGRGTPQCLGPSGPPSLDKWCWQHWRDWFFFFLVSQLFEAYLKQ